MYSLVRILPSNTIIPRKWIWEMQFRFSPLLCIFIGNKHDQTIYLLDFLRWINHCHYQFFTSSNLQYSALGYLRFVHHIRMISRLSFLPIHVVLRFSVNAASAANDVDSAHFLPLRPLHDRIAFY